MSQEEIIEVVSVLKANDKTMKDSGISDNLWGKAAECIMFLQSENATLRERLEKAVEFPFEVGSTVYTIYETDEEDKFNPSIDTGKIVSFSFDGKLWIFIRYNSGLTMWYTKDTFNKEVYIIREAAEARLVELKGENREQ